MGDDNRMSFRMRWVGAGLMLVVCSCAVSPTPTNENSNDNTAANANDNAPDANDNAPQNANDNAAANDNLSPDNDNESLIEGLVIFEDPDGGFRTNDARDIDGEVVRFDAEAGELIWTLNDSRFTGWDIEGNKLQRGFFCILFGSEKGERAAYFTETSTQTICDIVVNGDRLQIFPTSSSVPMN